MKPAYEGRFFWCFKETIKPEVCIKSIILSEKSLILQFVGKRLHSVFYWTIIGWYKAFSNNNLEKV